MNVKTIGIDLAKNVFQIHGVDEHGKRLFNKQLRRAQMASFFANIPPCLIGMEACASAHFWANKLISMGHNVKLMAPQFVKPYVKTNKHDAADAEAIWGRLRKRKKSYAKTGLASRVVGVPLVTPAGLRLGLVENSVLCGDDPRSCTHRRCAHRQQSPVAASYGRC